MQGEAMPGMRRRTLTVLLITGAVLGLSSAAVYAGARGSDNGHAAHRHGEHHGHGKGHGFAPNVDRFNLSGYKLETKYTLGRNTGNTFEQTYTGTTVQGVPVAGPFVGTTFPPADYVALPIAHNTLYVVWQDPTTHAIIDAFVMNFKRGAVFDYAPGSAQPESSGTVRILEKGATPLP
jgi:hypothetical protein